MELQVIKIDPAEFGLEQDKAQEVESVFAPVIAERDNLLEAYNQIVFAPICEESIKQARTLRLQFVKIRTNTDKIHKVTKAFYLAGGRFVDAWKNRNVTVIEQMEEKLFEIENHYENLERERIAALKQQRFAELAAVCDSPELYQVELMTDEAFANLIEGQKLVRESRIAAAKKAEEDRLAAIEAERIENERIRKENERLQAEAEAKEKQLEEERKAAAAKLKAEQDAAEAARLKAQAEAEAERKAAEQKAAKERAEADAKLRVEQEAAAKLRAELAAKEAAELKAKQEAELAAKKAANAPVKTKVTVWVDSLNMPEVESDSETIKDIRRKFEGFKSWAKTQLDNI